MDRRPEYINTTDVSWKSPMSAGRPARLRIASGHTLLLAGPAVINVRSGAAQCFGSPLKKDEWIVVETTRREPIFAVETVEAEVRPGPGGSWTEVDQPTIPASWSETAHILQQQRGVAVVVGEIDSGKSSLCAFLANECIKSGLSVGVVDGDVGQSDIGPPATISSSKIGEPIRGLQFARSETSFFIGDTSPSSTLEKLTRLLIRLKTELAQSVDILLVNTDGWTSDQGAVRHKRELLQEIEPDLVLGLSRKDEISPILDITTVTSLRLESSKFAKIRSKEERKKNREAGYRRFLFEAKTIRIDHDHTQLRFFDRPEQSLFRLDRRFRGFLVGLLKRDDELLGIGRIRDTSQEVTVETRSVEEAPVVLEIGNLALSSKYEEVGYGILH